MAKRDRYGSGYKNSWGAKKRVSDIVNAQMANEFGPKTNPDGLRTKVIDTYCQLGYDAAFEEYNNYNKQCKKIVFAKNIFDMWIREAEEKIRSNKNKNETPEIGDDGR